MMAEAATLRQLQSKVRALLPPGAGTRLSVDEEVLLEALGHAARPRPLPVMNSEVNAAISEALKGPSLLKITYRRRTQDKPSERIVAPHGLLLGVRRYLVARDTAKKVARLQHYRVEEIYAAEVLGDPLRSFAVSALLLELRDTCGFDLQTRNEASKGSVSP